ncbi:hypothetical protein [Aldersonia kunmingensis]|uniref:hypothetical protein n=1 Tax=Aldersonia kunmingensis TaxID=408066 RepID=UPI000829CE2F|nr:hypothetical protein [Aldersonia kunmingensis]
MIIVSALALLALLVLGVWAFGGVLARFFGGLLIISSLWSLVLVVLTPTIWPFLYLGIGLSLWLFGQWHFAAKYHLWKTPLARRAFALPALRVFDPTRRWARIP